MIDQVFLKKYGLLGLLVIISLIGILLVSGNHGKWICKDGLWVAQGKPANAKPGLYCDKYR